MPGQPEAEIKLEIAKCRIAYLEAHVNLAKFERDVAQEESSQFELGLSSLAGNALTWAENVGECTQIADSEYQKRAGNADAYKASRAEECDELLAAYNYARAKLNELTGEFDEETR